MILTNKNFPKYEPHKWNTNKFITKSHNCYSYALNLIYKDQANLCKRFMNKTKKQNCSIIKPQPGQNVGIIDESNPRVITCEKIVGRMLKDNPFIKQVGRDEKLPKNYYRIALFSRSDKLDYHYYRQDCDGMWSHKNGWRKATNKDNSGRLIHNPEESDRGKYDILCGYFMVPISQKKKFMSNMTAKYRNIGKNGRVLKSKNARTIRRIIKSPRRKSYNSILIDVM